MANIITGLCIGLVLGGGGVFAFVTLSARKPIDAGAR